MAVAITTITATHTLCKTRLVMLRRRNDIRSNAGTVSIGAKRLCYPRSVINAMTISNVQKQTTRLHDVAWSQKPHACMSGAQTSTALMQADQGERALIVGDREDIFFCCSQCCACCLLRASPRLLNAER